MALYDSREARIIVRIVYDGIAGAGKTTNLRQLCRFFTPVRRGELYTPAEEQGRTLFFDWLQLEGGIVAGQHLRCELVTVPGQPELAERRERLLATADGIVFVCDAAVDTLDETRERLALIRSRVRGELAVPVILQANKQDVPGALTPDELATALDAADLPIVAARAGDGQGVREAAVTAIRAVADRLQPYLIRHGTNALVGVAADPRQLYAEMANGDTAAEVLTPPDPKPLEEDPDLPPFPDPRAITGMVWPALSGRDTLRRASEHPPSLREDLAGRNDGEDGSGKADTFLYQAGPWCLKTSLRRRYADADDARTALLRLARMKLTLDDLLLPGTTGTVTAAPGGSQWLWTIAPWVTTLRAELSAAVTCRDVERVATALVAFADAAVTALRLFAARGLVLDIHPSNFARHDGRLVYIDDDIEPEGRILAFGHALLRRVDEYCLFESAVDRYIEHLVDRLGAFGRAELERLDVFDSLAAARPLTSAGQAARSLLLDLLTRRPIRSHSA